MFFSPKWRQQLLLKKQWSFVSLLLYSLVRFRQENHLVRVRKTSWLGLKQVRTLSKTRTETITENTLQTSMKNLPISAKRIPLNITHWSLKAFYTQKKTKRLVPSSQSCCFSLPYLLVNWMSVAFGVLVRQNKQFEDIRPKIYWL